MALVADALYAGLARLQNIADAAQAAAAWTQAYAQYAASATDVSTDPLLTSGEAKFGAVLTSLFTQDASWVGAHASQQGRNVSPDDAAKAFGDAFQGFWLGATFATIIPPAPGSTGTVGGNMAFAKETSSLVVAVNPANLVRNLAALFAQPTNEPVGRRTQIALSLHSATVNDVSVLITGIDTTVPVPLPITNTNTVY